VADRQKQDPDARPRSRLFSGGRPASEPQPRPSAPPPRGASPPPIQDLPGVEADGDQGGWGGRPLLLRRAGREYRVRDLDRMRRLIMERRARGEDLVSADGVRWEPLAHVEALQPYLAVSAQLDSAPIDRRGAGGLAESTAAEEGWQDQDNPLPPQAEPNRDGG